MIRIPDARRENVLKAAECGPDIIDIPMVDAPKRCRSSCRYARFAPDGGRGILLRLPRRQLRHRRQRSCRTAEAQHRALPPRPDRNHGSLAPPRRDSPPSPTSTSSSAPPTSPPASASPARPSHPDSSTAAERHRPRRPHPQQKIDHRLRPARLPPSGSRLGIDLLFCTNNIVCLKSGAQLALEALKEATPSCRTRSRPRPATRQVADDPCGPSPSCSPIASPLAQAASRSSSPISQRCPRDAFTSSTRSSLARVVDRMQQELLQRLHRHH